MKIQQIKKDFFLWMFTISAVVGLAVTAAFFVDKMVIHKDFYFPPLWERMPLLSTTMVITWKISVICGILIVASTIGRYIQRRKKERATIKLLFR